MKQIIIASQHLLRDAQIYQSYIDGLEYRQDRQAAKFGLSERRYKQILTEQKRTNNFVKIKKEVSNGS